jgi:cryptochrome 2
MRELWATGWIHNRIRVIVSSFAVKVLLLPWKWGMKYFWDTLLDADLESDILGWQYISGSLPDGHELERLECPQIQGSKFDPAGEYVRQWLPELARMPTVWIHNPWDAPDNVLQVAGVELGLNYPKPMIDLDVARERLCEAIFKMWEEDASGRDVASNGESEIVVDNSECITTSAIPKVILKDKTPCVTYSSNDQRVPSFQNLKNGAVSRKRAKCRKEEPDKVNNIGYCEAGPSRAEGDLCSTAESSASKKPTISRTASVTSFSVPRAQLGGERALQECESSEVEHPQQEDVEQNSSKNGMRL